jgi:hypothetical protein
MNVLFTRKVWRLLPVGLLLCALGDGWAQSSSPSSSEPAEVHKTHAGGPDSSLPHISLVFEHPQVSPNHFEIVVDSAGNGSYSSHSEVNADATDGNALGNQDLERTIALSPATRDRIFELAKAARYFNGEFDYTKSRVAFTGKKTLSYKDAKLAHSTTYNWSENQAIEELDTIFLGISSTLETGWRLQRQLQHEKLALNSELASLEQSTKRSKGRELQLIADVLQQIAGDGSVMGVARRRAERLLQQAK